MQYDESTIEGLISPFLSETGGLMRAMRALQGALGCVPQEAMPVLAKSFNITKAEVRGVITFYDDFKEAKEPSTVVRVCQAEACQSVGSRALTDRVAKLLGLGGLGERSKNGAVGLEGVFCLGLCSTAPAMMVGEKLVGRAEGARVDKALAAAAEEASA